tara:strand:+ start:144289 stop:145398 length:1110 start_codon:yes stop_codon:yes gene_type:complete
MRKILFALLIITFSCNTEKEKSNNVSINIEGLTDKMSVKIISDSGKIVDSARVTKENLSFTIPKKNIYEKYRVSIYKDSLKRSFIDFFLWQKNTDLSITGHYNDSTYAVEKFKITGDSLNDIQEEFNKILVKYSTSEITKEMSSTKNQIEAQNLFKKYVNLIQLDQIALSFKKPNNLVSINNVLLLGNRISIDSLRLYYSLLDNRLKETKEGVILEEISNTVRLNVGDRIMDFKGIDVDGNEIKLSDFSNKVILLDFWASWCGPCHIQNKEEFTPMYEKYKNKGFIIISYSLDVENKESAWKSASISDGITWVNISNLKGFNDPISKQYSVSVLPTSFIINNEGIIVKSFTGYDSNSSAIEDEIKKLLK